MRLQLHFSNPLGRSGASCAATTTNEPVFLSAEGVLGRLLIDASLDERPRLRSAALEIRLLGLALSFRP